MAAGVVVVDSVNGWVSERDTVLDVGHEVSRFFSLTVPLYADARPVVRLRLESDNQSAGRILYRTLDSTRAQSTSFEMSDIIIGQESEGSTMRRDLPVPFNARGEVVREKSLSVYYELYNWSGSAVTTQVRITQSRKSGGLFSILRGPPGSINVTFTESNLAKADPRTVQQLRTLDVHALEPGDYDLTIQVRSNGKTNTKHKSIHVQD